MNVTKEVQQVHTVTRSTDNVSAEETLEEEIVVGVSSDTMTTHRVKVF